MFKIHFNCHFWFLQASEFLTRLIPKSSELGSSITNAESERPKLTFWFQQLFSFLPTAWLLVPSTSIGLLLHFLLWIRKEASPSTSHTHSGSWRRSVHCQVVSWIYGSADTTNAESYLQMRLAFCHAHSGHKTNIRIVRYLAGEDFKSL